MCRFTILAVLVVISESVFARVFDQRQAGDLNVQVDLKNFKIFALTKGKEEYVDYDYAYDYSEMTIKPQNGTTTTIKPLNTTVTVMQINKDNETAVELVTTEINETHTTPSVSLMTTDSALEGSSSSTTAAAPLGALNTTTAVENSTVVVSDCKKGFFRNKGNCELRLQNPSNILLKMLQKSKSSGGNGVRKS